LAEATELPISYDEWMNRARETASKEVYTFISGGAGTGSTVNSNREAFTKWRLIGRMLKDITDCDISTEIAGMKLPTPLLLSPAGGQKFLHPEGERATATAAARHRVPFTTSTHATYSIEEIAGFMGDAPHFYELYPNKNREVMASFLSRAKKNGYTAILVESNEGRKYPRYGEASLGVRHYLEKLETAVYFPDPAFRALLKEPPEKNPEEAIRVWHELDQSINLTWNDIEFIRKETNLPVILKGVLDHRDVDIAISYGFDGIIVSNYGGRRLEGQIASLDALPRICDSAGGRLSVMFDGGVQNGSDAVKALALGADGVMIGRAYVLGLAVAGERGVDAVIKNMIKEIASAVGVLGCRNLEELDRTYIERF
jgi:lactate 2-monooxygenase